MGLEFIHRTLRTTAVVLLIWIPFGFYYFGFFDMLAVLSGGVWGMLNLLLVTALVRAAVRPGGADIPATVTFGVLKVLLYVAGYFLLTVPQFDALYCVAGFTLLLVVILLKMVARSLLHLNSQPHGGGRVEGTA